MRIKCAVTGSNGYLGSKIVSHLKKIDLDVIELIRFPEFSKEKRQKNIINFELDKMLNEKLLDNVNVLIHCAYDFNLTSWKDIYKTNVEGTLRLFRLAKKNKIKIIFISSMSSFNNCKSKYGKAKYILETELKKMDAVILRPGLIYGNEMAGIMGALNKLVINYKIIPIPNNGKQIFYLSHYDDICVLIKKIIEKKLYFGQTIISASSKKYFFKDILKILASRNSKKIYLIKINQTILYYLIIFIEKIKVKIPFKSDSLISMLNQNPYPNFNNQKQINSLFRNFD